MEIKLSRLKQIISEVVEERHASVRMDDIIQSTRGEEVDPHDLALDEMIAEEVEAAMEQFVIGEAEDEDMVVQTAKKALSDPETVAKLEQAIESDPKVQNALEQLVKEMEAQVNEGQANFNEIYGNFDPSKKHYAVDDPGRVLMGTVATPFAALGLVAKAPVGLGPLMAALGISGGTLAAGALGVGLAGAALVLYLSKKKKEADLEAKETASADAQ